MFYEPNTQLNGIILMSSSLRGAETSGFYLRDNAACINTQLHILPRHTHTEWGGRWCIIKMEADERSACRSTPPCIYRRVPRRPQKIETCLWIHTHFTVIMSGHWGVRVLVCVCVCVGGCFCMQYISLSLFTEWVWKHCVIAATCWTNLHVCRSRCFWNANKDVCRGLGEEIRIKGTFLASWMSINAGWRSKLTAPLQANAPEITHFHPVCNKQPASDTDDAASTPSTTHFLWIINLCLSDLNWTFQTHVRASHDWNPK